MFSEDYILRMINRLVAVLARVLGLKQAGKYDEARQLIDQSLSELTGLDAGLLKTLDDQGLYALLTTGEGLDTARLAAVAALFQAEGEVLFTAGRAAEAVESFLRALHYDLEATLRGESDPQLAARIDALLDLLKNTPLPPETLALLQAYEEEIL
ncbi:MAG: hypothetical protein JXB85_17385 [Anaerolineales bacterium]|nr:hypothetical protein [Anaerolineales bacterium]